MLTIICPIYNEEKYIACCIEKFKAPFVRMLL